MNQVQNGRYTARDLSYYDKQQGIGKFALFRLLMKQATQLALIESLKHVYLAA